MEQAQQQPQEMPSSTQLVASPTSPLSPTPPSNSSSKINKIYIIIGAAIVLLVLVIATLFVQKNKNAASGVVTSTIDPTLYEHLTPPPEKGIKVKSGASNNMEFFFPDGSFTQPVVLKANYQSFCAAPRGTRLTGTQSSIGTDDQTIHPLKPFRITVDYSKDDLSSYHVKESSLALYYCNSNVTENPTYSERMNTGINIQTHSAMAFASRFGTYGLIGNLICPEDQREATGFDDFYKLNGGQDISFNVPSPDLFDTNKDVDWYFVNLKSDKKYSIETTNVTSGVVPIIELSPDGTSFVQDNKANSQQPIIVDPKLYHGYIQIKLSPAANSKVGCDAKYNLLVSEN